MSWVFIPSQLQSYTGGVSRLQAAGSTLDAVLDDLDQRFPGLKFRVVDEQDRVRPHMKIFVGRERTLDLRRSLRSDEDVLIFGALSGG